MLENQPKIKIGDYIIIQRQKYTKLHKFSNLDSTAMLGKEQIILRNINEENYFSTFKMIPKDGKSKRISTLEICSDAEMGNIREILGIQESGTDNRFVIDNGESQTLKPEDIDKLKEECQGSSQILEKIVENSKTFHAKTEYSQEKYLKKKEKKYFEYVQIRQPTIRLLTEIYYRQDSDKIMGIRMDSLSQIISYSGISGFGNYLLYESGSNGLLPATFLNSMGANTEAKLVHMHPGNVSQKQAVLALNLPEEQTNRCISVNIYSALREFYQGNNKRNINEMNENINEDVPNKKLKLSDDIQSTSTEEIQLIENINEDVPNKKLILSDDIQSTSTEVIQLIENQVNSEPKQIPKWQIENKIACKLMNEKFDSLVIAAKEHPLNITKELLQFVKPSRPVVIFSLSREILMEMYFELKSTTEVTGLHLTSNWLRMLQILPNRTHPEVSMNGNSGFILTGYTIR